jgi:integrase
MASAFGAKLPPTLRLVGEKIPPPVPRTERRTGTHHLTDAKVKAAKPRIKLYKMNDGDGLNLVVMPSGGKLWRYKYRFDSKERSYSIGPYPRVTIAAARDAAKQARKWLDDRLDPNVQKRVQRVTVTTVQDTTFAKVATEWLAFAKEEKSWSPGHVDQQQRLLDRFLLKDLGPLPVSAIEAPQVKVVLENIRRTGALELMVKTRQILGQIFRHSIVDGHRDTDPVAALEGRYKRKDKVKHRATVEDRELPQLFKALADSKLITEPNTRLALYFQIATAARPGEVRFALWDEIDTKGKLWLIPAARMKMDRDHLVPLSPLALDILQRARTLSPRGNLIFPGFTRAGPLSENAFIALLARAGFFGRQTAHGFRASFSTWANDRLFAEQAIELCLAHKPDGVKADYNRSLHIDLRRKILTHWANHLIKSGLRLPQSS